MKEAFGLALAAAMAVSMACAATAAPYSDLVIDVNTGRILHQDSADAPRFPASLTKMMTLYVVFDMLKSRRLTLESELVVTEQAAAAAPSRLGLKAGDRIKVDDAIRALVTKSANDIAVAFAENLAGTEEKFARHMTATAKRLGMTSTEFRNASGLPDPDQHTTARDLATLSLHLYDDFPQYWRYFRTASFTYKGKRMRNHNGLLFSFQGTDGIKTGYTRASGFNLVSSVHRNGKHVIGVVIGGRSARARNQRMRELLRTALAKASRKRTRQHDRPDDDDVVVAAAGVPKPKLATAEQRMALGLPSPAQQAEMQKLAEASAAVAAVDPRPAPDAAVEQGSAEAAAPTTVTVPGPFHVQIGAFDSEAMATQKLVQVYRGAVPLLAGHEAYAIPVTSGDKHFYRARFAGFDEAKANTACKGLKRKKIDCVVVRAE